MFGVARLIVDTFSDLFDKILEKLGVSQETRDALTRAFESAFSGVFDFMEGLVETIGDMFGMVGILLGEGTWSEKVNKIGEKYFNWRDPTEKTLPENIIATVLKSAEPAMNDLGRFMLG